MKALFASVQHGLVTFKSHKPKPYVCVLSCVNSKQTEDSGGYLPLVLWVSWSTFRSTSVTYKDISTHQVPLVSLWQTLSYMAILLKEVPDLILCGTKSNPSKEYLLGLRWFHSSWFWINLHRKRIENKMRQLAARKLHICQFTFLPSRKCSLFFKTFSTDLGSAKVTNPKPLHVIHIILWFYAEFLRDTILSFRCSNR